MTPDRAQSIILVGIGVSTAATAIHNLTTSSTKYPPKRVVIGGFIAAIALMGVAEVVPDVAAMFSVLVLTATLLGPPGTSLLKVTNNLVK